MSGFRIDHLDGPRYDFLNGRYYGAGAAFGLTPRSPEPVKKTPAKKRIKKRRRSRSR